MEWTHLNGMNIQDKTSILEEVWCSSYSPLDKKFDYFWFKRVDWKMYMYTNKQHFKIFVVLGNSLDLDSRRLNS